MTAVPTRSSAKLSATSWIAPTQTHTAGYLLQGSTGMLDKVRPRPYPAGGRCSTTLVVYRDYTAQVQPTPTRVCVIVCFDDFAATNERESSDCQSDASHQRPDPKLSIQVWCTACEVQKDPHGTKASGLIWCREGWQGAATSPPRVHGGDKYSIRGYYNAARCASYAVWHTALQRAPCRALQL